MEPKRVVITGMGVISSVGQDVKTFWNNLCNGVCGIDYVEEFKDMPVTFAGKVKDFNAEMKACIEPFEKAFNTSEDNDLKTNLADYLKSIYYRFVDEGPEYKEAYDKYNKIVKEGL